MFEDLEPPSFDFDVERGELREHDSEFVTWVFLNSVCGVSSDCPRAWRLARIP